MKTFVAMSVVLGAFLCRFAHAVPNDFNNDGKSDLAAVYDVDGSTSRIDVWKSTGSAMTYSTGWASESDFPAFKMSGRTLSGDFDGDGKSDDIAVIYGLGLKNKKSKIDVWTSNGSSFSSRANWWNTTNYDVETFAGKLVAGDFNGDGKTDIAGFYAVNATTPEIHVWLSTGTSFTKQSSAWYSTTSYTLAKIADRVVSGDFNNDGKTDIAAMYDYGSGVSKIHVWLSTGSGFTLSNGSTGWWSSSSFQAPVLTGRMVAGDFNGDGKVDIAGFYYSISTDTTTVYVFQSTGSAFNHSIWYTTTLYNPNNLNEKLIAGDFNADGKSDIAGFYDYGSGAARIHVWTSNGSAFNLNNSSTGWWQSGSGFDVAKINNRVVTQRGAGSEIANQWILDYNYTTLADHISSYYYQDPTHVYSSGDKAYCQSSLYPTYSDIGYDESCIPYFSENNAEMAQSYLAMYRATKDLEYLNAAIDYANYVFSRRDDVMSRQSYDGNVHAWWSTRDKDYNKYDEANKPFGFLYSTGKITYPIADLAQIIINTSSLQSLVYNGQTYLTTANGFITKLRESLAEHDGEWTTASLSRGFYLVPSAANFLDTDRPNEIEALNRQAAIGRTHAMMYLATGESAFLTKAQGIAYLLLYESVYWNNNSYIWYTFCQTSICPGSGVASPATVNTGDEDVEHAAITANFAYVMYANALGVFYTTEVQRYANTLLLNILPSGASGTFWYYTRGSDGVSYVDGTTIGIDGPYNAVGTWLPFSTVNSQVYALGKTFTIDTPRSNTYKLTESPSGAGGMLSVANAILYKSKQ